MLEDRQNKIKDVLSHAATDRAEAEKLRAEYDEKIKNANSEAGEILSSSRIRAVKNEENIIAEAKEEAGRIIDRANSEAELEKIIASQVEYPGGVMRNEPIVNVLMLNLALDRKR